MVGRYQTRSVVIVSAAIGAVVVLGAAGTAIALGAGSPSAPAGHPSSAATSAAAVAGTGVRPSTPPAYGSPDYHSSSAEENALGAIARKIGATDAIGYYRDGASTIEVRFPAASATDVLPAKIGGYTIVGTNSHFTSNARLQATLGAVRDAVTAVHREGASGAWSYDAERDAVVVSGSWGQDVLDDPNRLPGVDASYGEVEEQLGASRVFCHDCAPADTPR